ncbi:MAG: hypothetical protein DWP95_07735 [Proteobacteria bacterium]|nr:MAG: hypothetical protein DWP95_07735 [Pseudomonadota bacterium]
MTISDRFYRAMWLTVIILIPLFIVTPVVAVFMLLGGAGSYSIFWLCQHPSWRQLAAKVLVESMGLLLILTLFVGFMVLFYRLISQS